MLLSTLKQKRHSKTALCKQPCNLVLENSLYRRKCFFFFFLSCLDIGACISILYFASYWSSAGFSSGKRRHYICDYIGAALAVTLQHLLYSPLLHLPGWVGCIELVCMPASVRHIESTFAYRQQGPLVSLVPERTLRAVIFDWLPFEEGRAQPMWLVE